MRMADISKLFSALLGLCILAASAGQLDRLQSWARKEVIKSVKGGPNLKPFFR